MILPLLLPVTFLFSFLGTVLVIRLSSQRHWLDKPNNRSSHVTPMPTAGGLAFTLVFLVATAISADDIAANFNLVIMLCLAAGIAILGFVDDLYSLGIGARIITQAILVIGALALFGAPPLPLPGVVLEGEWVIILLTGCGFLWFINLFNFMDGIDGLAAIETLFICLAVFFITDVGGESPVTPLILLLIAATSGFLLLNFPPARIFMGDTGSNFLGYLLGMLALASTVRGDTTIWVWCILGGCFIVDATVTLLARIVHRETWYYAHRTHAYQLLADRLGSHGKVVLLVMVLNCGLLLPLARVAHLNPGWGLPLTLVSWGILTVLILVTRNLRSTSFPMH